MAESESLLQEPPWKLMARGRYTLQEKQTLGMWEGFQDSQEKGRVLRFECVPQEFTGRNLILKFTY